MSHNHSHHLTNTVTQQQDAAIRLHNLTLTYHRHPVVHHISGSFMAGELTAIVGPNGAGKSTLLKAIVGLMRTTSGAVEFAHLKPSDIAYLPQQAAIARDFPLSVQDAVLLGDWRSSGWFGRVNRNARQRADAALSRVGLAGFGTRPVDELSAGQFQRVLFARLLLQDARLILLDEPFTALDAKTTADLLGVIAGWRREGRTVVAVLHDYEQVRAYFPQTLLLAKECIAWGPTAEVLTPTNLARANGMPQSWDEDAAICIRDESPPPSAPHDHALHQH
ncbi:metal ABC transporter ATP-binding protein [Chitinimonas sp. BJB300]|uniref:metal ABC transporter ATP-binding protein n=1 Tax=Chitinimonas sp. BJB300 TaxID=1559339 RepID=UPI000C1076B4|nr:ABC transporter ATP-binding protein [Chitinimonas sp. BJB300]PHV11080.1 ABC transporter [Chitinimonas sp. BJB300]TSJ89703.1 ABC transporter ATP-binding protein [Chitinimonas sp. BJB300]